MAIGTTTAVSAALSYFGARQKAKRQNAAIQAEVASLEVEKNQMEEMFRYDSLNQVVAKDVAGAVRIARQAGSGVQSNLGNTLQILDSLAVKRDLYIKGRDLDQRLSLVDRDIDSARGGLESPSRAGFKAVLSNTGVQKYLGHKLGETKFFKDKVNLKPIVGP